MTRQNLVLLIVIVSLAIALCAVLGSLYNYKQHQGAMKTIHEIQLQVKEKLVIDSIRSIYEQNHRSRLDSAERSFITRLDSLSILLEDLKDESSYIQSSIISTDSLLPSH